MSVGIKVTPEQLQTLSGQVTRGSGEIERQLGSLQGVVAPLVGGDWAGQAQTQFNALWEGRQCITCRRKDVCPVPLEEPAL